MQCDSKQKEQWADINYNGFRVIFLFISASLHIVSSNKKWNYFWQDWNAERRKEENQWNGLNESATSLLNHICELMKCEI